MDYALRNAGWITEFSTQPDTWIYVAEQSSELIAFTILSSTAQGEAEFRIALRADKLSHGLGRIISEQALAIGFDETLCPMYGGALLIYLFMKRGTLSVV